MTHPNPELIEPRFKASLDRYSEEHCPTGGFLRAVLENDLWAAIQHADPGARENLPHVVAYVYWELPSECWGTPARVSDWLARRPGMVPS